MIEGVVLRVIDADTIHVMLTDRRGFRVRLHGIDAPECGMPFGHEAQRYLESMVTGIKIPAHPSDFVSPPP